MFSGHICQCLDPLYVEEGCHYYGRPIPLYEHKSQDIAIVNIGGLLLVWMGYDMSPCGLMVAHPHLSLQQVLDAMRHCRLDQVSAGDVSDRMVIGQTRRITSFGTIFSWELYYKGRNRWTELFRRGGRVHGDLMNDQQRLLGCKGAFTE